MVVDLYLTDSLSFVSYKTLAVILVRVTVILRTTSSQDKSSLISNVADGSDNNVATTQGAVVNTQATAPQELTSMAATSSYSTPTMTFGDVGTTKEHEYGGYLSASSSVGEFQDTIMLERQIPITTFSWTSTMLPSEVPTYTNNMLSTLLNAPRNLDLIQQFKYIRCGLEVTVRLNTNQFYYGALMATLYPTDGTGALLEQRAVLDPMVISACSTESLVKTWKYSWPQGWMDIDTAANGDYPVTFNLDVLSPLNTANPDMPEFVDVFVWARLVDVELAYPSDNALPLAQSGSGFSKPISSDKNDRAIILKRGIESNARHPSEDSGDTVTKAITAIKRINIEDALGYVKQYIPWVLDKPDMYDKLTRVVNDGNVDMFISDIPDTNPFIGLKSERYLDPSESRMPLSRNYTVSQYAQIPGLRRTNMTFTTINDSVSINMNLRASNAGVSYLTPLDYAIQNAIQWRGSVKVCLQFFASSFFSARFVVQYYNAKSDTPSTDYSAGISRVINVKGDTVDVFTLPFLSWQRWYQSTDSPTISLTLISNVASTSTTVAATVSCTAWIAGGEDIQFAYPSTPYDWGLPPAETSIGSLFRSAFPTINPNCKADIDSGFCTNEELGSITSICKRYAPLIYSGTYQDVFSEDILDASYTSTFTTVQTLAFLAFNSTFFGSWRQAFLYRSGGFKWRSMSPTNVQGATTTTLWQANIAGNGNITMRPPLDSIMRMTFPQVDVYPFRILNPLTGADPYDYQYFVISPTVTSATPFTGPLNPHLIAARDDLQFGFPILPARVPAAPTSFNEKRRK